MIGKTLAHYKILEKLGSGGMGDVYRAQDAKLERDVALKILPLEMADDPERRKRFEREAKAIAALKHPHIVTIHSIEESEGSHFITMELVKGRTLSDIISTGNLSLAQFFELTIPLADAVASAHASGIIHRDLKPANIMLDADGTLKVLDFGLAKMNAGTADLTVNSGMPTKTLTEPGIAMGTLPYMSPEQLQGRSIDTRSDIFSLGVIFYELATGRRPFGGTSTAELASSILRDEPTPLNDVRSDYPAALHAAVSRCLEKNAHARYATAGEVLAALETVERSPATPTPASADPSGGTIAVFDFENITRDSAADWLSTGIAETVTADLKKLRGISVVARDRVVQTWTRHVSEDSETAALLVGRELGATLLVRGAFQNVGDHIRITGHIMDTVSGALLGSIKLDGALEAIFDLQDRILTSLLESAGLDLSETELKRIGRPETFELQAYKQFSYARQKILHMGVNAFQKAEDHLLKALEIDPNYAMAHAAFGQMRVMRYIATTDPRDLDEGLQHLQKAIDIDPELSEPYIWMTYGYARLDRFEDAIAAGEKAVELDRNSASAYFFYAAALWLRGASQYQRMDWETPSRLLDRAIKLTPAYQLAYMLKGDILVRLGRNREARRALEKAVTLEATDTGEEIKFVGAETYLGWLDFLDGDLDASEHRLRESRLRVMSSEHVYAPQFLCLTLCCLGDVAEARGDLDKAIESLREALASGERHVRALGMGRVLVRAGFALARVLHRADRLEEASEVASRAETLFARREQFDFSVFWLAADADILMQQATYLEIAGRAGEAQAIRVRVLESGWISA